jgi:hypothetical protein
MEQKEVIRSRYRRRGRQAQAPPGIARYKAGGMPPVHPAQQHREGYRLTEASKCPGTV